MKQGKIAVFCVALLFLAACSAQNVPVLQPSIRAAFDTAVVQRGNVSSTETLIASVVPEFVPVVAPESGLVQKMVIALGDEVQQGDVLLQIGTEQLQEKLDRLNEQLNTLKRDYDLQSQQTQNDLQIVSIQKNQENADVELLEFQEKSLQAKKDYLYGCFEQRRRQCEREIAAAEQAVADSYVYAPCSGVIAAMHVRNETQTNAGAELLRIARADSLYLRCNEGNSSLAKTSSYCEARIGEHCYPLELIPYSEEEYRAAITSGYVPARFKLPEDAEVSVGQSAQLIVYYQKLENTLYLPRNAVFERSGIHTGYVYRIVDGEKLYTDVTYALQTNSWVAIESGLEEGDVVYVPQS